MSDWERAQADFNNWPIVGTACDGAFIRRDPSGWGDGVFEIESGTVLSPVAYSVRKELRERKVFCFGDKN